MAAAPAGLEGLQRRACLVFDAPLFDVKFNGMGPHDGQAGVSQQGQRDVTIPAAPGPYLVLVQTNELFRGFEAFLDTPLLTPLYV